MEHSEPTVRLSYQSHWDTIDTSFKPTDRHSRIGFFHHPLTQKYNNLVNIHTTAGRGSGHAPHHEVDFDLYEIINICYSAGRVRSAGTCRVWAGSCRWKTACIICFSDTLGYVPTDIVHRPAYRCVNRLSLNWGIAPHFGRLIICTEKCASVKSTEPMLSIVWWHLFSLERSWMRSEKRIQKWKLAITIGNRGIESPIKPWRGTVFLEHNA